MTHTTQKLFLLFLLVFSLGVVVAPTVSHAACQAGFKDVKGVCFPTNTGLPESDVETIVLNYMKGFLRIFGFLAIIMFVGTGLNYLMAFGNEEKIEGAKRAFKYSLIGVLVALGGVVIVRFIEVALGG